MIEGLQQDAAYAARVIRSFLDGASGDYDWDDFTSCSLSDPDADSIRLRAARVSLPGGDEEQRTLIALAEEAESLARGTAAGRS